MSCNEYYFSTGIIQPNSVMRIKKSNSTLSENDNFHSSQ